MRIYVGYKFRYQFENESDIFTVLGSRSLRGKYFYIMEDSKGKRQSLSRNSILEAIDSGILTYIA